MLLAWGLTGGFWDVGAAVAAAKPVKTISNAKTRTVRFIISNPPWSVGLDLPRNGMEGAYAGSKK
jgi:hypothetical protein